MDLGRDEVDEVFPSDRGCDLDDVDLEPWVSIERTPDGWVVVDEVGRRVVDDASPWQFLVS